MVEESQKIMVRLIATRGNRCAFVVAPINPGGEVRETTADIQRNFVTFEAA